MATNAVRNLIVLAAGALAAAGCNDESIVTGIDEVQTTSEAPLAPAASAVLDARSEFLINGDLEEGDTSPTNWWFGGLGLRQFDGQWTDAAAASGTHSVMIDAAATDNEAFAYWAQTVAVGNLVGSQLTLTTSVKLEDVTGGGVAIAIRGDDTPTPQGMGEAFSTTQRQIPLAGTHDWTGISVDLSEFPVDIQSITIYLLVLPNTTGRIFFDDAGLSSGEPSENYELLNTTADDDPFARPWWAGGASAQNFDIGVSDRESRSPSRSLTITKDFRADDEFGFWAQTIRADRFVGGSAVLSAWIKIAGLRGQGVAIAVRGDSTLVPRDGAEIFASTQGTAVISGSRDWSLTTVTVLDVPESIKSLTVYLILLPDTQGSVYFDDISLSAGGS